MICNEVQELLSGYHDGEITVEEEKLVRQHLKLCTDCTARLYEIQEISNSFRVAFSSQDKPLSFEAIVMSRIDEAIQAHQTFRIKVASVWNSIVLLALTGIVLFSPTGLLLWGIASVMMRLLRHLYILLIMTIFGQGWLTVGIVTVLGLLLAGWSVTEIRRLMRNIAV